MATIAEFTVPADSFPLGRLFGEVPDATVELDRIVPTGTDVFPYFWVSGVSESKARAVLDADEALRNVVLVDGRGDERLFRATWNDETGGLVAALTETDVFLLTGIGTGGRWTFEIRADSSQAVSAFQQRCRDADVPLTLRRLRSLSDIGVGDEFGLTDDQYEALRLTFEEGYYSEPREATLDELADSLGITRQSLSSRLRRGYHSLIRSTIVHGEE